MGGGSFGREQREDDRLKHCWAQVRILDGKEVQPGPHPLPHFVVQKGLLYCVAQRRGRTSYCSWCLAQRWRPCWSWRTRTPWPAISGRPTRSNGFRTLSTGPVPRGDPPVEGHSQSHRSGALPAVQLSRHLSGDPDRSGNPLHFPANG